MGGFSENLEKGKAAYGIRFLAAEAAAQLEYKVYGEASDPRPQPTFRVPLPAGGVLANFTAYIDANTIASDVILQVLINGSPVLAKTIPAGQTGVFTLEATAPVERSNRISFGVDTTAVGATPGGGSMSGRMSCTLE